MVGVQGLLSWRVCHSKVHGAWPLGVVGTHPVHDGAAEQLHGMGVWLVLCRYWKLARDGNPGT